MPASYDSDRVSELAYEVPCHRHPKVKLTTKSPQCPRCKWEDGIVIHFTRTPKLVQIFPSRPVVRIQLEALRLLEYQPLPDEEANK